MSKQLDVYLHDALVGQLEQDKNGRISFAYGQPWLDNAASIPLSHSLPLRPEAYEGKDCQGFFAGVLPEEENRKIIAAILGISPRNDFALLEQIGGECAGAVTFLPAGTSLPHKKPVYQPLTGSQLTEILRELPQRPLMAGRKDVRLSLAGAQNKLAIHMGDKGIALPLHSAPSTHILKPTIPQFDSLVHNEAYCMTLAGKAGLPTAVVTTGSSGGIEYLLAMRYDRHLTPHGELRRIHQEDFCQALGFPPHIKYQNEGGPSLKQCFALIRNVSSTPAPDLLNLLDAVTFNVLIGNNDAHGKNFSFLYETDGAAATTRLAPFYDLVSTRLYPQLSEKMAMKIGSEYLPREIQHRHWQALWHETGLSENAARKRALQFTDRISQLLSASPPEIPVQQEIAKATASRVRHLKSVLV